MPRTGHGTYKEIRRGVFEICWRPAGARGPRYRRRLKCTAAEASRFLAEQHASRTRGAAGLPVSVSWDDAVELYRSHQEAKGLTEQYRSDVGKVLVSLRACCPDLERVEPMHVQTWLDTLARTLQKRNRRGWANTVNHWRNMASGFFKFMGKRTKRPNPIALTDPFTVTKRPPRNLRPNEFAALWRVSEPSVRDLLDFSLLTGCRLSEMAGMRLSDVSKAGVWTCQDRKGHDYIRMELPASVLKIVHRQPRRDDGLVFHKWATRRPGSDNGHGFNAGEPVDKRWFEDVLKFRSIAAGIAKITPHNLRSAAATWAREAGCSPWHVQSLMGHSTVTTTEMYARPAVAESGTKVAQSAILKAREKALKHKGRK